MPARFSRPIAMVARCAGILLLVTISGCTGFQKSKSACCASVSAIGDLRARVAPPHEKTIAAYIEAGAVNAKAHQLTKAEWALVERAFADLPRFYQIVLRERLARLSFIDAPSSMGTALTRSYDGPEGEQLFDITIRADVLETSLTDFLERKEERLFVEDNSGYTLHIAAGKTPALRYLLLHEASHVIDQAYGITSGTQPFASLWKDYLILNEPYASRPIGRTVYRRGPQVGRAAMPDLYKTLAGSPFVSLYSTASAGEDFAELAAWSVLSRKFKVPLMLQVKDAKGLAVLEASPLSSPAVRLRLNDAQRLLSVAATSS